ncbi:MAG: hypothetical protein FD177_2720 [Desulfovibrionaceae bacterium]|nr:MAG: hypothetical protein FD177_2720 [Desulfovibrionaceae bacterium]
MITLSHVDSKRRKPLQAIRAFCLWCSGGSPLEVRLCPANGCAFYPYRGGVIAPGASRSLLKAIKTRCLDCKPDGAADCDAFEAYETHPPCPCWPFRMGRNPNIGAEQREKQRRQGKRQMNFTGQWRESAPRNHPVSVAGETCGQEC